MEFLFCLQIKGVIVSRGGSLHFYSLLYEIHLLLVLTPLQLISFSPVIHCNHFQIFWGFKVLIILFGRCKMPITSKFCFNNCPIVYRLTFTNKNPQSANSSSQMKFARKCFSFWFGVWWKRFPITCVFKIIFLKDNFYKFQEYLQVNKIKYPLKTGDCFAWELFGSNNFAPGPIITPVTINDSSQTSHAKWP